MLARSHIKESNLLIVRLENLRGGGVKTERFLLESAERKKLLYGEEVHGSHQYFRQFLCGVICQLNC